MRNRHPESRGAEFDSSQPRRGERKPDRIRQSGLQDPSLVKGPPVLVGAEAADGRPEVFEPFARFTGGAAFVHQAAEELRAASSPNTSPERQQSAGAA